MKFYVAMAKLALLRPWMVPTLIRAAWAFRARHWYRRPPFLPIPPSDYWLGVWNARNGAPDATPPTDDLKRFLAWADRTRSDMRRRARGRSSAGRPNPRRAKSKTRDRTGGRGR